MGFVERHADRTRQAGDGGTRPPDDRYGSKPQPGSASNEPSYDPAPTCRSNADPVGLMSPADPAATLVAAAEEPAPRPAERPDLTVLLGRSVREARVQRICRQYGLIPDSGTAADAFPSRSYLSRGAGVELAADTHGTVTAVFLHFHGDDGFQSFRGEIPGGAGSVPCRAHLRAMLGAPDEQGDPYHDRFLGDYGPWDRWVLAGFALHAQFAMDGESLDRVTLTLPSRRPHGA
jgi:hypothetical protein